PAATPPKILFAAIRRRAWPVVRNNGLSPAGNRPWVVLAVEEEMALRLGRRLEPEPVLVTVQAVAAADMGYAFRRAGERLFVSDYLPPEVLSGPPLREEERPASRRPPPKHPSPRLPEQPPGSIILDEEKLEREIRRRKGITKDIDWKRETRRERRRRKK
ncbi:MAG: hypothetical protein KJ621_19595, partial [Proteobacteria bacterium]|nr:hypothetical protein [Pseudomonadota bacterium]